MSIALDLRPNPPPQAADLASQAGAKTSAKPAAKGFQALLQGILAKVGKSGPEQKSGSAKSPATSLKKAHDPLTPQAKTTKGEEPARNVRGRAESALASSQPLDAKQQASLLPNLRKGEVEKKAEPELSKVKEKTLKRGSKAGAASADGLAEANLASLTRLDPSQSQKAAAKKELSTDTEGIKESPAKGKSAKDRISLLDMRKKQEGVAHDSAAQKATAEVNPEAPKKESSLTLELFPSAEGGGEAQDSGPSSELSKPESSFSTRLTQRLQDVYNADIVKHSTVILRDGDSGVIRLNLKPEALGNVKVRLDLADNNITGTIIVESEAAKDAFEANLEHLAKTFIDSGFQDAKLSVSVDTGSSADSRGKEGRENPLSMAQAAKAMESSVPEAQAQGAAGPYGRFAYGVNIVV